VHTPLIFFAPSIITENKTFNKLAGQIDVFPSIMGLLNMEFDNSTMGINLFQDSRPFIFFNSHDKYGVIDKEWLLILYGDHSASLYNYLSNEKMNYADKMPDFTEKMRTYLIAHIQTYQYLIR
jgi:phosphoglycerol transferase MdoB-like AlkP superfamily enzyme